MFIVQKRGFFKVVILIKHFSHLFKILHISNAANINLTLVIFAVSGNLGVVEHRRIADVGKYLAVYKHLTKGD